MAQVMENPYLKKLYFKHSVAYTEDHIPVQKIQLYAVSQKLNELMLKDFFGMFGPVLRLQLFKPRTVPYLDQRYLQTGYVLFAEKTDAAKVLYTTVYRLNGSQFHVKASDSWQQPDAYGIPRHLPVGPPPPVMSLNDHCLQHVMAYLTLPDQIHFARTCLRFRAVYQMATVSLHKSVNLGEFGKMTVWDMRDFFELSGAHVKKLFGMMPSIHANRLCDFLANKCTNLKTIRVVSNIWSEPNIHKVLDKMEQLETLVLPMQNISDHYLWGLRNLRKLKTLDLSHNPLIGDTMALLPSSIESLTLNDCQYINGRRILKILKTFHLLKELNIKNIDPRSAEIYENMIKQKCCNALQTLRITGYGNIHYEYVAQIPNLKHLSVFVEQGLREELFEQLAMHKASQLECLEIIGAVDASIEVLRNIAKLTELRALILPHIKPNASLNYAFGRGTLKKLEKLFLRDSCGVSNEAILKVFRACPRLSYIGVRNGNQINEELAMGIVSRVQQEIANKDMHRKLPIELYPSMITNLDKLMEDHSGKLPKDIIQIKERTSSLAIWETFLEEKSKSITSTPLTGTWTTLRTQTKMILKKKFILYLWRTIR
ncbi:uncharacterized protein LOC110177855 [Drosophila serrata]|uniref:uncharacterized protein LOC110177855 n=1 Tax=Drosophila serrata TaxID=7274 RepID=UPI000A1D2DBA|nr:uncharacterized protein LOC110177855 [Drosophila serrata]